MDWAYERNKERPRRAGGFQLRTFLLWRDGANHRAALMKWQQSQIAQ